MKSLAVFALLMLFAFQVIAASDGVTINAEGTEDLENEEKDIVNAVSTLLGEFVRSKGNLSKVKPIVISLREKAETKMKEKGAEYLKTLAAILSRIEFPDKTIKVIANAINNAAKKST